MSSIRRSPALALAAHGLHPTTLDEVASVGEVLTFRAGFRDQGPALVHFAVDPAAVDPFQRHLAATRALTLAEIPRVSDLWIPPSSPLAPALLMHSPPPGLSGAELLKRDPEAGRRVATGVGRVLWELRRVPVVRAATRADAGQFVPRGRDWREEWARHADEVVAGLDRAGMPKIPELSTLRTGIEANIGRLPERVEPGLVHGRLSPRAVHFAETPSGWRVSAVLDWHGALAGDPWIDVATLLSWPLPFARRIVSVAEIGDLRQEPDALNRLVAYGATQCLEAIVRFALRQAYFPTTAAAVALDQALVHAQWLAQPDSVERRLNHWFGATSDIRVATIDPERIFARRLLLAISQRPRSVEEIPHLLGAIACWRLARESESRRASRLLQRAHAFLDGLLPGVSHGIAARSGASTADLLEAMDATRAASAPALTLALIDAVATAFETTATVVPALVWIRLGDLVRSSVIHDRDGSTVESDVTRLRRARVGRWAAARLGRWEDAARFAGVIADHLDEDPGFPAQGTIEAEVDAALDSATPEDAGSLCWPDLAARWFYAPKANEGGVVPPASRTR